jgi:hypothetical protein
VDSKNIFGVLTPGAGGGLRVRENALNEGHQACRTKKPIDEGFRTRGVGQAELKGCHHGIYSFGDHFQKQGHSFAFRLGFGKVAK